MAEYDFRKIEAKWQSYWEENKTFLSEVNPSKPKYYVLDMFPYPSGAGLHVGHPLGYIASDIVSRFKRLNGFNVLHPMGFDSFGLPAEQYAIQTGQHPAITTEDNINRYKEQLGILGLSYDWTKEVRTSSPDYYKWTQWIFIEIYNSWYDQKENKARKIEELVSVFESEGNTTISASCDEDISTFTASQWSSYSSREKSEILLKYRLAFLSETTVNWCPALGTVLANDEIKEGLSERGGHPVERKKMLQWSMRISAYADRLLQGLEDIDFSDSLKEMQRNWIGKSYGASISFDLEKGSRKLEVFTTRPDTVYGVTYVSVAPEQEWLNELVTEEQKEAVATYVEKAKNRSERERMSDVKTVSGVFTGSYGIHPLNGNKIPVWVADYVLAGYGTGVVMAVPSSDTRDYAFAKHFDLPIISVQEGDKTDISKEDFDPKAGTMINSEILNGLSVGDAIPKAIQEIERLAVGKEKINYKIRDAVFSRQRYWGEPIPVFFDDNNEPVLLQTEELPLELPDIQEYKPTETGEPPLGRADAWLKNDKFRYELSTMPGWAGSSWYLFRYMDPSNEQAFASTEALDYWENVDLYIGGSEHATGHLLYSRFWTKLLHDLGHLKIDEPFKKLINQGMIQGRSNFVYRVNGTNKFVSYNLKDQYDTNKLYVDVSIVKNDILDTEAFKKWRPDYADAEFILEDKLYHCGYEVEKMSKSKYNVVNPDDIVKQFGADTFRLYEMFLGPLEQSKPWSTNGIDGVHKFLKKLWRLYHTGEDSSFYVSEEKPNKAELKVLHSTIKKVGEDISRYSFNTSVSNFMICVNELSQLKCNKRVVLEDLVKLLSPYAPHIVEELWEKLGHEESISASGFPEFNADYLKEDSTVYPVMVNGKMRSKLQVAAGTSKDEVEKLALADEKVIKWTEGKTPKKIIVVPNKIVNIVL